jgi:hypothetical protein
VQLEGFGKLKKSTSSGTRTGNLPACSVVPQPTTLPRAPTYILILTIRWRWCDIILHAPTEDKIDDIKGTFYYELERVFFKFPKSNINIL